MKKTIIKWLTVSIITIIYLTFSFKIGYWLTGDIHNGGPLIGLIFTPVVTLTATLILFFDQIQIRKNAMLILTTLLFFVFYTVLFNQLSGILSLKIYKEYYFIYEHSTLINSIKWVLIILSTLITYFMTRKIITRKKTIL